MARYICTGVLGFVLLTSPVFAQPTSPPIPGSGEIMYICPESPGLRFGKAQLNADEQDPTYHVPVCHDGKFLGKIAEFPAILRGLDGWKRWILDVRLSKSLQVSDSHRGFHTLQRGQDFVRGRIQEQTEVRDARGRPLRLFE